VSGAKVIEKLVGHIADVHSGALGDQGIGNHPPNSGGTGRYQNPQAWLQCHKSLARYVLSHGSST
jgi:hypothetical protein